MTTNNTFYIMTYEHKTNYNAILDSDFDLADINECCSIVETFDDKDEAYAEFGSRYSDRCRLECNEDYEDNVTITWYTLEDDEDILEISDISYHIDDLNERIEAEERDRLQRCKTEPDGMVYKLYDESIEVDSKDFKNGNFDIFEKAYISDSDVIATFDNEYEAIKELYNRGTSYVNHFNNCGNYYVSIDCYILVAYNVETDEDGDTELAMDWYELSPVRVSREHL